MAGGLCSPRNRTSIRSLRLRRAELRAGAVTRRNTPATASQRAARPDRAPGSCVRTGPGSAADRRPRPRAHSHGGSVDGAAVNRIAETTTGSLDGFLSALWTDCPQSSKDLFHGLVSAGVLDQAKCGHSDLEPLAEKGFVKQSGSKIQSGCRLLDRFVAHHKEDVGSMVRLFGNEEAFKQNARPLFQKGSAGIPMPQPLWNIENPENLSQIVPKGHRTSKS